MKRPHMRKVRSTNTTPELRLRKLIYGMGFRGYRVHYEKLPGKPDVVFVSRRRVIFVHGCFWHGHDCRAGKNRPKSNVEYWEPKLLKNRERDRRNRFQLEEDGWNVLTIWECELKNVEPIADRIRQFLH